MSLGSISSVFFSARQPLQTRVIVATIIGNGFAAYDFTVFSFYVSIIAHNFFPRATPSAAFLMSLATFGAGFFMRPLGAVWLGRLADRHGRKAGIIAALTLATLGTWTIAVLPGYASIGIAAPIILVAARFAQGLAAGGEIGPTTALLMEVAQPGQRCYLASWRGASQGAAACVAALLAAALTAVLPAAAMNGWGWRVPFFIGGLIAPVGWFLYTHMPLRPVAAPVRISLTDTIRGHHSVLLHGVLLMAAPSISVYLTVFYMPTYLVRTLHRPATISLLIACLSGLLIAIATPLAGAIADRLRNRKSIQYASLAACLATGYPVFSTLTRTDDILLTVLVILGYNVLALSTAGANSVLIMEALPIHHRAMGMSTVYAVGVTLFGGTAALGVAWLIELTGDPMIPGFYLTAAIVVSLYALYRFPSSQCAVPRLRHEPMKPG